MLTIWIMVIFAAFITGMGFRSSIELRLSKYYKDKVRARFIAQSGIEKAKMLLAADKDTYDTLYACGISRELLDETRASSDENPAASIFSEEKNELKSGRFSIFYYQETDEGEVEEYTGDIKSKAIIYGLRDEESKVDIRLSKYNAKIDDYKKALKKLSPEFTDELINAMIDWQDADSNPMEPGGAEKDAYAELGYEPANAEFKTVEELLLVKGVAESGVFDSVKDDITAYGSGKININTAPRRVLECFIDVKEGEDVIGDLMKDRKGVDGIPMTSDDGVQQLPVYLRNQPMNSFFVFASTAFSISCAGVSGAVKKIITCVVDKESAGAKGYLYYKEQ